ncbi:MAG: YlmH/Sll1252 family protein [Firmicutes bacterium]|nr:YlmH/Sll1252 family protein [Bacillota bacterium]
MDNSEKLLLSKADDLFLQCQRQARAKFSAFLDGGEQAIIEDNFAFPYGVNTMLYGGYENAERRILGAFPEWEDANKDEFPISVLKISSKFMSRLSHRDILGALMSQGVDRSKTGDILIDDENAYIFVCRDIAPYFTNNITKIGNQGVKITVCNTADITLPEPKTERMSVVAASCRIDAVTAALCGISRSAAAKLISSALVKVNHREVTNPSRAVQANDLISVRGHGRFVFVSLDGETAKGRAHITAKKFI